MADRQNREINEHETHTVATHPDRSINAYYPGYQTPYGADIEDEDGFDFWATVYMLWRRKWLMLAIVFVGVLASIILNLQTMPLYRAVTTIEIQEQEQQILEQGSLSVTGNIDNEFMETQFALLRSRSLAERVADMLDLPSDAAYADQSLGRTERLNEATTVLSKNISIKPEGRSRIIRIAYTSPMPQETSRIANALVGTFIETALERKYNTSAYARNFLEERLAAAKAALEASERQLAVYAADQGILELGGDNGSISLESDTIIALNSQLAVARSQRISSEQTYRAVVADGTNSAMLKSPQLSSLELRKSELMAEYLELGQTFRPEYPAMVRLRSRIDALDTEIVTARNQIIATIRSDFDAAVALETSLQNRISDLRNSLQELRDRRIQYTILEREVDTNRAQYEALLQRLKEITTAAGIGNSQIAVIDRALTPKLPFEPNLRRAVLQALTLSMAFAVGIVFALNYINDQIRTPEDVKTKLGLPAIGTVPIVSASSGLMDELRNPRSILTEAYFSARAALDFATDAGAPKSIMVTSIRPSEGKTTSSIGLAMAFANSGRDVLIIDADLRRPSFVVEPGASIGLSGLLTQTAKLSDNIATSSTERLFLLPAGIVPPNPAQLLASDKFADLIAEAESLFDVVIVDTAPIANFSDAPRISNLVESTLLVLHSAKLRTPTIRGALGRLLDSNAQVSGVILNKFNAKAAGGYYNEYYAYSDYGSYTELSADTQASVGHDKDSKNSGKSGSVSPSADFRI